MPIDPAPTPTPTSEPAPTPAPSPAPNPAPQRLFLAVDPATKNSDLGCFVVTYTIANAPEAEERLRHLLIYLSKAHGEEVDYWFSAMAIERAKEVKWDEVHQRPISVEETDLDDLLLDDIDWTDTLDASQISFAPAASEELARPPRAHLVSNNPFEGENDSVGTFYHASDLPAPDGENSDHRNAEASMRDGAEGSPQSSADAV
jgi:hypothetical protein